MEKLGSTANRLALYGGDNFSTKDPVEASNHLGNYLCSHEIRMQSTQPVSFQHRRAEVGQIGLHALHYGAELTIEGYADENAYIVLILTEGEGELIQNDVKHQARPDNVVVINPGKTMSLSLSADESNLTLRIPTRLINDYVQRETGIAPSPPIEFLPILGSAGHGLRRFMAYLCNELGENRSSMSANQVSQQMEQTILSLMLSELAHDHKHLLQTDNQIAHKPASIQAAEEFIAGNSHLEIGLDHIAQAAKVSIRTLQKGFQQYRNTTPIAALRERRLQSAHDQLLRSNPLQHSVTDIAYSCGFSHLSRFSLQYKQRFGEAPSDTLKKSYAQSS